MPSTAIHWLSYDEVTSILFVAFVDGDTYAYFEVAPALVDAFRAAKSKGGFFARHVRGRYRYQRMGDAQAGPAVTPDRGSADRAWRPRAGEAR